MANQCKQCGTALSLASTFCRTCGTLTGVDGAEATVIVRVPQPDRESPWAKTGARYQAPVNVHGQVQRTHSSHSTPSEVELMHSRQTGVAAGCQSPASVIDFVPERRPEGHDGDSDSGETRIIGKSLGGFATKGWLVALSGPKAGESWVIRAGKNLIGRNPGLAVTLTEDAVSGMHATLWIDNDGGVTLVDRDSSNGTFVNGEQIFSPVRLSPGDLVRVGESTNLQWVQFQPMVLPPAVRLPPGS
jgi:hypothetical protein